MAAFGVPPSVLPDISPARGEIGWSALRVPSSTNKPLASTVMAGRGSRSGSISPLVGEMPGKAEGGASSQMGRDDAR